jgi:hypothetical protein
MPLLSDQQFKVSWPANTTPQAPDGSGTTAISLTGYSLTNTAASARSVKFYDLATAPTVGTTVPKRTVTLAASGGHIAVSFVRGIIFKQGLWISVTQNAGDSDNTAPAANDVLVTVDFQP